jgi:hypothetical protein
VLAYIELARTAHVQNDPEPCRLHLRDAEALLTLGSGGYLAAQLRSVRDDTRFVSLETPTDLRLGANERTDRELAVVRLLPAASAGRTSIRHKLGVPGRSDIGARAIELGIIERQV